MPLIREYRGCAVSCWVQFGATEALFHQGSPKLSKFMEPVRRDLYCELNLDGQCGTGECTTRSSSLRSISLPPLELNKSYAAALLSLFLSQQLLGSGRLGRSPLSTHRAPFRKRHGQLAIPHPLPRQTPVPGRLDTKPTRPDQHLCVPSGGLTLKLIGDPPGTPSIYPSNGSQH